MGSVYHLNYSNKHMGLDSDLITTASYFP